MERKKNIPKKKAVKKSKKDIKKGTKKGPRKGKIALEEIEITSFFENHTMKDFALSTKGSNPSPLGSNFVPTSNIEDMFTINSIYPGPLTFSPLNPYQVLTPTNSSGASFTQLIDPNNGNETYDCIQDSEVWHDETNTDFDYFCIDPGIQVVMKDPNGSTATNFFTPAFKSEAFDFAIYAGQGNWVSTNGKKFFGFEPSRSTTTTGGSFGDLQIDPNPNGTFTLPNLAAASPPIIPVSKGNIGLIKLECKKITIGVDPIDIFFTDVFDWPDWPWDTDTSPPDPTTPPPTTPEDTYYV